MTCAEHDIPFTTDKTNFQPLLTIRNGIRDELSNGSWEDPMHPSGKMVLNAVQEAKGALPSFPDKDPKALLKLWVQYNAEKYSNLETQQGKRVA